jgi:hypothetical protein
MPMLGSPPDNLAAVSLIRAAIADDPDSGVLILSQHGGCLPGAEGMKAAAFMVALAGVSARALLSAHGYNVERALEILDTWAAEYADNSAVA